VKISKEVRIGILAVVTGVMLYYGFNFLKGSDFFSKNKRYYVVYQNVYGLTESNAVLINGLTVGKVKGIRLLQDKADSVLVTLEIWEDILLNDSTSALISVDFLGTKTVVMTVGKGKKPKGNGDTLRAIVEKSLFSSIQEKAQPVVDSLNYTMGTLRQRLTEFKSVEANLDKLLISAERTSNSLQVALEENQSNIRGLINNLYNLSAALNDPKTGIKPLLSKANTFADSLNHLQLSKSVEKANHSIDQLNQLVTNLNNGQGSMGKLLKMDSLHRALVATVSDLDSLFVDLKARPKHYVHFSVFGRKDKESKKK
jgi:phospholipid/cholesterol/gamma-HCH transport system substrate-binding protein